jgi:hypothetical protein
MDWRGGSYARRLLQVLGMLLRSISDKKPRHLPKVTYFLDFEFVSD